MKGKPPKFSKKGDQEQGVRFVRLVKKYPCLYDYDLPEYSDRESIDAAWKRIADEMKSDPRTMRDKWRNFRTVFLRRSKAEKKGIASGSQYYLMDEMSFLLDYVRVAVPLKDRSEARSSTTTKVKAPAAAKLVKTDMEIELGEEDPIQTEIFADFIDAPYDEPSTSPVRVNYSQTFNESASAASAPVIFEESNTVSYSHNTSSTSKKSEAMNPRRMFCASIGTELDNLTDKQFRKFRKMCLDFLDDCEDDN